MRPGWLAAILCMSPVAGSAQLVAPTAIPNGVIPVVFLNGYQLGCTGSSSFAGNFGKADTVLQASGLVSVFFDNCSVPGGPSIETLGAAFGKFLASLTYVNGTPVPVVDVVAHSMGGLIVRAYLSGMQPLSAGSATTFVPPPNPGIRKAVFLATPHFGTFVASNLGNDNQTHEMSLGSQFLFALNTWNQGTDDLRGVDALAIAGNGGTGWESAVAGSGLSNFDDGVVELTSASIGFAIAGRTRVVADCHTGDSLTVALGVCGPSTPAINAINDTSNLVGQIITSFLTGTKAWQSLGEAIEDDPNYNYGGVIIGGANANGASEAITGASGLGLNGGIAYKEALPVSALSEPAVSVTVSGSGALTLSQPYIAGTTTALIAKPGPTITGVVPAGIAQFPRDVAPGAFVTVYGSNLTTSGTMQSSQPYPTQLGDVQVMVNETAAQIEYISPGQINFIYPAGVAQNAGPLFLHLTVKNSAGQQTVSTVVVPAVPSIFTFTGVANGPAAAENAVTGALINGSNALHAGDYVALFLTGIGVAPGLTSKVTVGGQNCAGSFFFAGAVASYEGLDQINCQIPAGVSGPAVPVVVTTNGYASNTATLSIQ